VNISIRQSAGFPEQIETYGGRPQHMQREAPEFDIDIGRCTIDETRDLLIRLQGLPGIPPLDLLAGPAAVLAALNPHFARRLDLE